MTAESSRFAAAALNRGVPDLLGWVDRTRLVAHFERALREGGRYAAHTPARSIVPLKNAVGVSMPCYSPQDNLFVVKSGVVKLTSGGVTTPTVAAEVTAFSAGDGQLVGHFDGATVTRLKCYALSAVVLANCAGPGPHNAVIVGTGVQAWEQFLAMEHACSIREYCVIGRSKDRTEAFANRMRKLTQARVRCAVLDKLSDALAGASLVATATRSNTPLDDFSGLARGAHINCMGGHTTVSREVPREKLRTSLMIVEERTQAMQEAGLVHEKAIEVEEMFSRKDASVRPTVFSSTGNAYHDLLVVSFLLSEGYQVGAP